MADRSFCFIMTTEEYGRTIWSVSRELCCTLVLSRGALEVGKIRNSHMMEHNVAPFLVFFVRGPVDTESLVQKNLTACGRGSVLSRPPERVDDHLITVGDIAVRTHWWDQDEQMHDNPALLDMFKEVRKRFRKGLKNGLWAGLPGTEHWHYMRSVWYSEGARAWFEAGKELGEPLPSPVRYSLVDPRHSPA